MSVREVVALPADCRRVHLVGGAGCGKTTLARALSVRLGVPAFDLDMVGWEGGAGAKRPLPLRLADVEQIMRRPGWITEGIYLWWVEELLAGADLIIWLDVPWRTAAYRILLRHVRAELSGFNKHTGWRKLVRFLRRTYEWYRQYPPRDPSDPSDDGATSRAATERELRRFRQKTIRAGAGTRFTYEGRPI